VSAGGTIDFTTGSNGIQTNSTAILPIDNNLSAAVNHSYNMAANSTEPLFLVLGISFYQQVNGKDYPLKNGAFNALSIVKVSGV
jgi:hypothetical protein